METEMRQCPHCAEDVRVEAKVCKHCRRRLTPEAYQRSPLQWALIAMVIVGGFGIIGLAVWEFIAEERREAELECQRAEQRASYLINEPTTGMDTPEELRASADELFAASDAVEEAC